MKAIQLLAVVFASCSVSLNTLQPGKAEASTFYEVGDAGQSLTDVEDVGVGVNAIQGTINTTTDVDLYRLSLAGGLFQATTVQGVTNNLDTMLWLFDSTGKGIVGNDDSLNTSQSTISATISSGTYYLGISNYDIEPTSASGLIFDYSSGSQKTKLLQATGTGSAAPLTNNWTVGVNGSSPQGTGKYRILLNSTTVNIQQAPEPNTLMGLAVFSLGSLLLKKKVASNAV